MLGSNVTPVRRPGDVAAATLLAAPARSSLRSNGRNLIISLYNKNRDAGIEDSRDNNRNRQQNNNRNIDGETSRNRDNSGVDGGEEIVPYEEARRRYTGTRGGGCVASCEAIGQLKDKVKELEEKVRYLLFLILYILQYLLV